MRKTKSEPKSDEEYFDTQVKELCDFRDELIKYLENIGITTNKFMKFMPVITADIFYNMNKTKQDFMQINELAWNATKEISEESNEN